MKQSEITKQAGDIIKNVFSAVTKNDDKDAWKKALDYTSIKIQDCVLRANKAIATDINSFEANDYLEKKEIWAKVKYLLIQLYGKKFIQK